MGQPSNPRPTSPHHRSLRWLSPEIRPMEEALAEVVNWGHGTLGQIEAVESNLRLRRQTAGIEQVHRSRQTRICIVMKRSIRHCSSSRQSPRNYTQPLQHTKARSSQVSDRSAVPRSNVCATYTSTRIATTTRSSAAVRPAGRARGSFRSSLALTPGCFIGTTRRD